MTRHEIRRAALARAVSADPTASAVYQLFHAYEHAAPRQRTQHAYVGGLHALARTAIVGGLRWDKLDAFHVSRDFDATRGKHRFYLRRYYQQAIECGNKSAVASFERSFDIAPWIWPAQSSTGRNLSSEDGRVCEGSIVWFENAWWSVTSAYADHLVLCLYEHGRAAKAFALGSWWTCSRNGDQLTGEPSEAPGADRPVQRVKLTRDRLVAIREQTPTVESPVTTNESWRMTLDRHGAPVAP